MDGAMNSNRVGGAMLLVLGLVLSVLGFMESRYMGQRVLYLVAGLAFVIAGAFRLTRREPEQR